MQNSQIPSGISIGSMAFWKSVVVRFLRDLFYRPKWHLGVLGIAALVTGFGWAHRGYHAMSDNSAATVQNSAVAAQNTAATQPAAVSESPWNTGIGAWSRRVGASVLLGYVIGWAFRAFLKIMASITVLVLGIMGALSYFNIMNVDMTSAETKYKDATSWVTDQAGKVEQAGMNHLHSTGGGALGLFLGVRRKNAPVETDVTA